MSDYDHEYQTCTRKVRYESFKDAWTHLAHRLGHQRHRGRWLRGIGTYPCQYCGGYHNGHAADIGEDEHVPMRERRRQWNELKASLHSQRKAKSYRGRGE